MKKLILVLILVLVTCKSSTAPEPTSLSVEDYFPYDEYTEFTYAYIEDDDTAYYIDEVTGHFQFEGEDVYEIDDWQYQTIIDGEWREYGEHPEEAFDYFVVLTEPLEVGTELSYSYINKVGLTLNTEFGTLEDCIEVLFPNNGQKQYYAPRYGLIKDIATSYTKKLVEVE